MSITHVGAALDAPADLSPTERLILVVLARHAAPDGMAAPSISHVAQSAHVSVPTARRALGRLSELGLIQRTPSDGQAWRVHLNGPSADGTEEAPA